MLYMATALACSRLPSMIPATEKKPFSLQRMRAVFQRAAKPTPTPEELRGRLQELQGRQKDLKMGALGWLHFAHLDFSWLFVGYMDARETKWLIPLWKRALYRTAASLGAVGFASLPIVNPNPVLVLVSGFTLFAGATIVTGSIAATAESVILAENSFQLWRTRRQLAQSETGEGKDLQNPS